MSKAKVKPKKELNPHLQARVAFLHRASQYMVTLMQETTKDEPVAVSRSTKAASHDGDEVMINIDNEQNSEQQLNPSAQLKTNVQPLSRILARDIRSVARKSQIRLSRDVKRSICKVCDTPLIEGQTATTRVENLSKGHKSWADVSCISCNSCGTVKRFPIGMSRPEKKSSRRTKTAG